MSEIRIDVNVSGAVRYFDGIPKRLADEVRPEILRTVIEIARTARRKAPKALSNLVNSVTQRMESALEGVVFAGQQHGIMVEEGTGIYGAARVPSGKRPPIGAILDWIRVRRIVPDQAGTTERDLAWMIATKIAQTGTPKQPFMRPAAEEHRATGIRRIQAAIARATA